MTVPGAASAPVDPQELAQARIRGITARGKKKAYTERFDLSGIPPYRPARPVTKRLRQWGDNYLALSGVMPAWQEEFRRHHPSACFDDNLASSAVAFPGLIAGQADLAPMGRQALWTELKGAERQQAHLGGDGAVPLEITVCTGSYNVSGWTYAFGVFVNAANPISRLTFGQLDGIFGAERAGGWQGLAWDPGVARGPEGNIRTWGQLGLTGGWENAPIGVYGYNLSFHFPDEFDKKVLKNSQKWNESMVTFANRYGDKADGTLTVAGEQMIAAVSADPFGITYTGVLYATDQTKAVALARTPEGPYIEPTLRTVQDRSYPLVRDIYYYLPFRPEPGQLGVDPEAAEFMRFLLCREAQQAIQDVDAKYLPLTAQEAARQRAILDRHVLDQP
jgi:phosphate transport system substrate-binding protein